MSKVRLYGSTSGYVDLQAPAVSGDVTITLPNASGPFALESYVDEEIAAIPPLAGIGSNVVQTVKTDIFSTTSGTFANVTGLSVAITPTFSTSKILVICQTHISNAEGGANATHIRLSGGNSGSYVGNAASARIQAAASTMSASGLAMRFTQPETTIVYLDSPATTSAVTYQLQMRTSNGSTGTLNYSATDSDSAVYARVSSSITAIEVKA